MKQSTNVIRHQIAYAELQLERKRQTLQRVTSQSHITRLQREIASLQSRLEQLKSQLQESNHA